MTFKERFQARECSFNMIEDWIELWHTWDIKMALPAFLGLSEEEYGVLLVEGYDALARRLNTDAETHYMAVHLEWEDLENQLNELIRSLLSAAYTVHMKRSDFYYWDIVLHKNGEISEKDSEYICERLDLRDISTDHFLYSDSIDQNQACGLLEKLFGREIVSSHADDEGVWFFHKPLYASSRSWVAQHVGRFEQRLNMEIGNRHYPATTAETAAHQLYGFVTALKELGMVSLPTYWKIAMAAHRWKRFTGVWKDISGRRASSGGRKRCGRPCRSIPEPSKRQIVAYGV